MENPHTVLERRSLCFSSYKNCKLKSKTVMSWSSRKKATFSDTDFFDVSCFSFKENQEDNPSEKILIVEEELDGIDSDGIGNLAYLLRLVFINGECWNPKVAVDGGEIARNIN